MMEALSWRTLEVVVFFEISWNPFDFWSFPCISFGLGNYLEFLPYPEIFSELESRDGWEDISVYSRGHSGPSSKMMLHLRTWRFKMIRILLMGDTHNLFK